MGDVGFAVAAGPSCRSTRTENCMLSLSGMTPRFGISSKEGRISVGAHWASLGGKIDLLTVGEESRWPLGSFCARHGRSRPVAHLANFLLVAIGAIGLH